MKRQTADWLGQVIGSRKKAVRSLLLGAGLVLLTGLWFTVPLTQSVTTLSSTPTVIVAGGDPSPVGGVFASDGTPAIGLGIAAPTDTEAVAFVAFVNEGKAPLGIFLVVGDTITTVAAVGDPTPLGGTFAFFSGQDPRFL
jgi:hypothetical protein